MIPISLEEAKSIELNILKTFARQCEEHNLRYYLTAGTLLGAVRHSGFIPWDDDIDVTMPREDYEQYYRLFASINDDENLQLTSYRDRSSIYPFFKLIDRRTIVFEEYVDKRFSTGIWVDIFPLDGAPTEAVYKINSRTQSLFNVITADPSTGTTKIRKALKRLLKPILSFVDIYQAAKSLDTAAAANPIIENQPLGLVVWGYGPQEIMPFELLEHTELPFEGSMFRVPKLYSEYLSSIFGDYLKLPPEDQRIPHGFHAFWRDEDDNRQSQ